jgi:type I restriction enzyme S subunit
LSKRNENRPGYKKSCVGWLPTDWKCVILEHLCDFITKGATPTTYGFEWVLRSKGIPFLRSECVSENGLSEEAMNYISEKAHWTLERSEIIPDDILMTITGNVGRVIIFPTKYEKANINQHIARIRINNSGADRVFVFQILKLPFYKKYYNSILTGQAYPQISLTQVRHTPIPLPPHPEQKKIAEILSAWDRAIEQTRKLIKAKKCLKKGLMQQLLSGRIRFPQFGKPITKEGETPNGWIKCKLDDCFTERKETNPILPLLSITSDRGVIPREDVERKDTSSVEKTKYKLITPGDIGYNTMRMWQGVSAVSTFKGIVSPAYTICTPKSNQSAQFFGYLFKYPPIIHIFHRYSQGMVSDTLNLKFHNFEQIRVSIPSLDEQEHIAKVLNIVDNEIAILNDKEITLLLQKKGLMQKLLTGEVRVVFSERQPGTSRTSEGFIIQILLLLRKVKKMFINGDNDSKNHNT